MAGDDRGRALGWALAEYIRDTGAADLPDAVRREAVRSFVNWLGCGIGGSGHPMAPVADRAFADLGGAPQATVIGRGRRTDVLTACLLNGIASSAYGFDDTHAEMVLHPAGPVAAALLALAERRSAEGRPVDGGSFLAALVLGVEIECRIGRAISVAPGGYDVGWSLTGITVGIGAAAGAGKLLGLDAGQLVNAMSIASSAASGTRAMHGTMSSALMPAQSGHAGLRAALLAEAGFDGGERFLEGPHGYLALFGRPAHAPALTAGLGRDYEILGNTYKPYPCGIVVHPTIDACLELRARGLPIEEIAEIAIEAAPVALTLTDRPAPRDALQAKVSLQHWAAAALVDGKAGLEQGRAERVHAPAIAALRARVRVAADPALAPDAARVTVTLQDGSRHRCEIVHCTGSKDRPMSDADISTKFTNLADGILPAAATERLLERSWSLPDLPDVAVLAADLG